MEPVGAPGMAQVALRLGNLVGVVGEGVVHAAAVEVQVLPVVLHGDAGALDVPAGVAHTPGGVPLEGLVLKLALGEPEDEVISVALVGVLLHALPDTHGQVLLIVVVEDVVPLQLGGVKVHVAHGKIRVPRVHQLLDDPDIVADQARGGLNHVRSFDVQLPAVLKEGVGVELRNIHDGLVLPLGALEHLVLAGIGVAGEVPHIGDVHDAVHVVPGEAEVLLQHVLHDIAPEVPDVGEVVHRRAAGIHFHPAGGVGFEFFFLVGRGIIKIHKKAPPYFYSCSSKGSPSGSRKKVIRFSL